MEKRNYHLETEANFGLDCEYCRKGIRRLPCKMICVEDAEDWVYFHQSCYKKFRDKLLVKGSDKK